MTDFIVVIPARYGSTRLPGKPLLLLAGKPMIQHVVERAQASQASRVVVATDDERIITAVNAFGGESVLTRTDHASGSDRIAEVAQLLELAEHQIIVNVQGDEPDMPAELINQVANALEANPVTSMATACTQIDQLEMLDDPNVVKVVRDAAQIALYFSRAALPFDRDQEPSAMPTYRHLGIYAYRAEYVQQFAAREPCVLEQTEKLEQLRALWHGERIICVDAVTIPGVGIDTPADYEKAKAQR